MIRKAGPEDAGAIAAFLSSRIESSMFLLGNLESYGIDNSTHPFGTTYFLRETGDGINGVFGCTNGGYLMCQLPGLTATEAQTYAHLLKGYTLRGMTGDAEQVGVILDALPVAPGDWEINSVQPLFRADIADLVDVPAEVRAPNEGDRALLNDWFVHYMHDTGMFVSPQPEEAEKLASSAISSGRVRLLIEDGGATAMAGINAQSGAAVQVGGVYVPSHLRGAGRAGRVVAGHLKQLAKDGRTTAILFVASAAAGRAYEKIGFTRAGDYRIAMLLAPKTLGGAT